MYTSVRKSAHSLSCVYLKTARKNSTKCCVFCLVSYQPGKHRRKTLVFLVFSSSNRQKTVLLKSTIFRDKTEIKTHRSQAVCFSILSYVVDYNKVFTPFLIFSAFLTKTKSTVLLFAPEKVMVA